MKKRILISVLLLSGIVGSANAGTGVLPGVEGLTNQINLVATCAQGYLDQEVTWISSNGNNSSATMSSFASSIDPNNSNTSVLGNQSCNSLVDTVTVDPASGAITVVTKASGTDIAPPLTSQTFVFQPTVNDSSTPFAAGTSAQLITGNQCAYTASSAANLTAFPVAGSTINLFNNAPSPLLGCATVA